MIYQVNPEKISNCYCDAFLKDNYALVFISLFGATNSVRTVWAQLRQKYGSVFIGEDSIHLNDNFRYLKFQNALSQKGMSHLVLTEEKATHQINEASEFYQIGENPEEDFFYRLDRLCSVPFRESWKSYLWEQGLEHNLIRELLGFGMKGFRISTEEDEWSEIVLSGLKERTLR